MSYTLRAARIAAALATYFCSLWNANARAWFGVAHPSEHYLVLIPGLSLCALLLSMRDGLPHASRISLDWYGHFLLGALYHTLPKPTRIDHLTGQSKPIPIACGQ